MDEIVRNWPWHGKHGPSLAQICGICNKGKLKKFKDKTFKGVNVSAYKCEYGHVSYSSKVMAEIEASLRE